jgi:four helix bundle protein
MNSDDLKKRTKKFALQVINTVNDFPRTKAGDVIGRQLIRSATSVGANYRSACRARSHADFIAKMGIVEEEADESLYWLELAVESGMVRDISVDELIKEADQLTSIFTSSRKTAKRRKI